MTGAFDELISYYAQQHRSVAAAVVAALIRTNKSVLIQTLNYWSGWRHSKRAAESEFHAHVEYIQY